MKTAWSDPERSFTSRAIRVTVRGRSTVPRLSLPSRARAVMANWRKTTNCAPKPKRSKRCIRERKARVRLPSPHVMAKGRCQQPLTPPFSHLECSYCKVRAVTKVSLSVPAELLWLAPSGVVQLHVHQRRPFELHRAVERGFQVLGIGHKETFAAERFHQFVVARAHRQDVRLRLQWIVRQRRHSLAYAAIVEHDDLHRHLVTAHGFHFHA